MLSDRRRAQLAHPIRRILLRAAAGGAVADAEELGELDVPDEILAHVRECSAELREAGAQGGLRSKHRARAAAEQMSDALTSHIPPSYRSAVPREDPHEHEDIGGLVERIHKRRTSHPSSAEDQDDREALREAVRAARAKVGRADR